MHKDSCNCCKNHVKQHGLQRRELFELAAAAGLSGAAGPVLAASAKNKGKAKIRTLHDFGRPCILRFPSSRTTVLRLPSLGMPFGSLKGGDPAAPSGTATLLRLHPSH